MSEAIPFGPPFTGPLGQHGRTPAGIASTAGYEQLGRPNGSGDWGPGPWAVTTANLSSTASLGAAVVSSPLFKSDYETSVLALTAGAGQTIAAQCRPKVLDRTAFDPATGVWLPMQCDVTAQRAAGATGTAKAELVWLDKSYAEISISTAWTDAAPPTSWVAKTSWSDLVPPSSLVVYVAIRLTWSATGSVGTCYFREPALVFKGTDFRNLASNGWAERYA